MEAYCKVLTELVWVELQLILIFHGDYIVILIQLCDSYTV